MKQRSWGRLVGVRGVPQSHNFRQPHFANQAKLSPTSDTFKIGVTCLARIARNDTITIFLSFVRGSILIDRSIILADSVAPRIGR